MSLGDEAYPFLFDDCKIRRLYGGGGHVTRGTGKIRGNPE
ncbi:MAG: hypothetical protein Ct9H90mP24_5220 [Methanobacteriota archaeon]|nr:MAG: hypothetical protein Ct9H90mP24_5220 [Euryarchaeota archaeon]